MKKEISDKIKKLQMPEMKKWIMAVLTEWSIILCLMYIAVNRESIFGFFILWLCTLVIGNRIHALGILFHEAAHQTISSNRNLNKYLGTLFCGMPLGFAFSSYKRFHMNHHRNVGTLEDPELFHLNRIPEWTLPMNVKRLLIYLLQDLFLLGGIRHLLIGFKLMKPKNFKEAIEGPIPHFLILSSTVILATFTNSTVPLKVILIWYYSLLTSFWFTYRCRIFLEHIGAKLGTAHRYHAPLWLRLTIAPHNCWIHSEHHWYPKVSCFNLPKLRSLFPEPKVISISEVIHKLRQPTQSYLKTESI